MDLWLYTGVRLRKYILTYSISDFDLAIQIEDGQILQLWNYYYSYENSKVYIAYTCI